MSQKPTTKANKSIPANVRVKILGPTVGGNNAYRGTTGVVCPPSNEVYKLEMLDTNGLPLSGDPDVKICAQFLNTEVVPDVPRVGDVCMMPVVVQGIETASGSAEVTLPDGKCFLVKSNLLMPYHVVKPCPEPKKALDTRPKAEQAR